MKITERHVRWAVVALAMSNAYLFVRLLSVEATADLTRDRVADADYGVRRIERQCSCASR